MKFALVASALASILMLYGNNSFSVDVLNNTDNLNHEEQVNVVDEKSVSKVQNVENKDYVKSVVDRVSKSIGRAVANGQAMSYVWTSLDKFGKDRDIHDISGSYENCGVSYDAILRLGAELLANDFGIKYGVDFQVAVPSVKGGNFGKKAALNRGSKIFAATPYGDFSVGYQEGVESIMKLDASSVIAGDESNIWTQRIRGALSERKNALGYSMYPFLLSAGLYSENVFRNNDNAVLSDVDMKGKDFINSLPLRMSYQSPSFMGLRFGVSYSPLGYKFDLFDKKIEKFTDSKVSVITGIPRISVSLDKLKDLILSGNFEFSDDVEVTLGEGKKIKLSGDEIEKLKFYIKGLEVKNVELRGLDLQSVEVTQPDLEKEEIIQHVKQSDDMGFFGAKYEHIVSGGIAYDYDFNNDMRFSIAVVGEYANPKLYFNTKNYNIYPDSQNLQGLSIGYILSYNKVNFAAAYGYLGKSGFATKYRYGDTNIEYPIYERSDTYYWDAALGYQYNACYVSIAYFNSKRSGNVLQDISLGFEYNLLKEHSKMKCKLFGNYHYYMFSEVAVDGGISYDHGSNTVIGFTKREKDGSGNVLLAGIKLEF